MTTKQISWRVVAGQECRDLWLGGRGPLLLFGLSVLLSAMTYLAATSQVLNFLEQREAVNLILQIAVAVGVLITLVVSADAISGERERGTLESLLLTPASRRSIALGKLAAALSLWIGAFLVTVPYLWALGHGVFLVGQALVLGLLIGSLLAIGLGAVGLLISSVSRSNKVSVSVSLFLLFALFAPTQLPSGPAKSALGDLLDRLNPVASSLRYLTAILVNGHTWTRDLSYLISPVVLAVLAGAALIALSPRLIRLFGVVGLLAGLTLVLPGQAGVAWAAEPTRVTFDRAEVSVLVGDRFTLQSQVENTSADPTEVMLAHLNVASLTSDVYVDPEDWSAERSQSVEPIDPGDKASISWDLQAINPGSFDVYLVLLPNSATTAGQGPLTVSAPVHVTVTAKRTLSADGALPIVFATPFLLGLLSLGIRVRTRRRA